MLTRRDKQLLALVGCASVAGAAALGVTLATGSSPSDAGCVVVDVPSTMGGARLRSCGAAAHAFCHAQGKANAPIATACRRQGYAADVARP